MNPHQRYARENGRGSASARGRHGGLSRPGSQRSAFEVWQAGASRLAFAHRQAELERRTEEQKYYHMLEVEKRAEVFITSLDGKPEPTSAEIDKVAEWRRALKDARDYQEEFFLSYEEREEPIPLHLLDRDNHWLDTVVSKMTGKTAVVAAALVSEGPRSVWATTTHPGDTARDRWCHHWERDTRFGPQVGLGPGATFDPRSLTGAEGGWSNHIALFSP